MIVGKPKILAPSNFANMLKPAFFRFIILSIVITPLTMFSQAIDNQSITASTPDDTKKTLLIDSSSIIMAEDAYRYMNMMDSLDQKTMKRKGYRIQIFSNSGPNGRKDALEEQAEFLNLYSDVTAYTRWSYPNWVVRLGDFRTHLEALEFHHEVREIFPASFIVKDEIKTD